MHAGDTMTVETRTGDQKVPVKAIFKDNPVIGDVVMSFPLYEKVVPPSHQLAYLILVQSNGMYGASTMKAQLQNSLAKLKILRVQTTEEFAGRQAKLLDSMLSGLYALLMLSIIIAVLGVVNTLALSVTERRQEIGMLRAIGMSRASLRQMFYLESIVLSVFGTVLGTAAGTLLGWALTNTMSNYGISIVVIPWQMIVGVLVGSVVVGVLAALGPAKRAAKISPLRAIAD
ncbi:MAG: FtsX-like permease family protein [Lawsonella clevelandensis]